MIADFRSVIIKLIVCLVGIGLCVTTYRLSSNHVAIRAALLTSGGEGQVVALPVNFPSEPGLFKLAITLELTKSFPTEYRFVPDDCLLALTVNEKSYFGPEVPFCDYTYGRHIDLTPYLHSGTNTLGLTIRNNGGPGGFQLFPIDRGFIPALIKLSLVLAISLLSFWFCTALRTHRDFLKRSSLAFWNMLIAPTSFGVGCATLLALLFRIMISPYETQDQRSYLYEWHDFILSHGGIHSLRYDFSDYNAPYLYLLVLSSYLTPWIGRALSIKLGAIIFDYFLAYVVYRLVALKYPRGNSAILAYIITLFLPTVWINSSMWGQCDSIYATFLLLSVYLLLVKQPLASTIAFSSAFAFKLQGAFMLSFLLLASALGELPIFYLLALPLVFLGLFVPAWLLGRPLQDALTIYLRQTDSYRSLSMNAPNPYRWFPDDQYPVLYPSGMVFALGVFFLLWLVITKSRRTASKDLLLSLAFLCMLLVPYVLPKMHERYFYPAELLALVFAFYFPRYFILPILLQFVAVLSYLPFLAGRTVIDVGILAIIPGVVLVALGYHVWQLHLNSKA